jgi:hypothetical protein
VQLLVCNASRGWTPTSCLDAVDGLRDLGGGPQKKGCPEHHRKAPYFEHTPGGVHGLPNPLRGRVEGVHCFLAPCAPLPPAAPAAICNLLMTTRTTAAGDSRPTAAALKQPLRRGR